MSAVAAIAWRLWTAAGLPSAPPRRDTARHLDVVAAPAPAAARSWGERFAMLGAIASVTTIVAAALASRARYIVSFDGTYGSGDAHAILVKALHFRNGELHPSNELVLTSDLFDQPPLVPAVIALVSWLGGIPVDIVPLIVVPLLTTGAIVALWALCRRTLGWPIALTAALLVGLLPRLSFDSTEPEKAPFVLSFAIAAMLAAWHARDDRRWTLAAGALTGLAMSAHTTGYLFVPVVAGTYLAAHASAWRSAFNRYAAVSLLFPLLSIATYFMLARVFGPEPLSGSATGGAAGSGVVPEFVRTYIDVFANLGRDGVSDRAWGMYTDAIRAQVGVPIFTFAVIGFAIGTFDAVISRKWQVAPFVLWGGLITLAFAMQYPASSHGSRYPSYVTPAYIVLALYGVWRLAEIAAARSALPAGACAVALVTLAVVGGVRYGAASNPGLRDLYASHEKAAAYVTEERLFDDERALYMGWPSLTFNILDARPDYGRQLITFGFGSRPLETFDREFIESHGIGYYLYDHTGRDRFGSADVVKAQLEADFMLQELASFGGRAGSYTTVYRLHPRPDISPDVVAGAYWRDATRVTEDVPLVNGAMCADDAGSVSGWEENGSVTMLSAQGESGCRVLIVNNSDWGGVRQTMAPLAPSAPFSIIARVQPAGSDPAATAALALYSGSRLLTDLHASLHEGDNYLLIQGFAPSGGGALKLVLATGEDDTGDIIVEGMVMQNTLIEGEE